MPRRPITTASNRLSCPYSMMSRATPLSRGLDTVVIRDSSNPASNREALWPSSVRRLAAALASVTRSSSRIAAGRPRASSLRNWEIMGCTANSTKDMSPTQEETLATYRTALLAQGESSTASKIFFSTAHLLFGRGDRPPRFIRRSGSRPETVKTVRSQASAHCSTGEHRSWTARMASSRCIRCTRAVLDSSTQSGQRSSGCSSRSSLAEANSDTWKKRQW